MKARLLLSPLTTAAYFDDAVDVALAEFGALYPDGNVEVERSGPLVFIVAAGIPESQWGLLARLSFVQAVFGERDGALFVSDAAPLFDLPQELVTAAKYRGKTNELVTQLAINVALAYADTGREPVSLLDPMAGRGTTLLWAARYGLDGIGIEVDPAAQADMQRHVKKQTKLQRIKHKQTTGTVGSANRKGRGQFLQYQFGDRVVRLVCGDTRDAISLLQRKQHDVIVTDIPYGVHHTTPGGTRNPLETLAESAPVWRDCLRPGGAMTMIFNANQPKRSELIQPFEACGLVPQSFAAPHRMSESIVRDLVVFTKPRSR